MRSERTDSDPGDVALTGPIYCDTSALVKLYLPEDDSARINQLSRGRRDLVISDLCVTEIVSSLCRRRREGSVKSGDIGRLHQALLTHVRTGAFRLVELLPETHREAERLLLTLEGVPLRSADALHLALAISAGALTVLTCDHRLAEAARTAGLGVAP